MPTFSVIIPTYGRPQFLQHALESVLHQSVDDLEVVVVDDASPKPVVVPKDSRVTLVRASENQGAAGARNLGVEASSGTVLAFVDDDDWWANDRLRYAASALERAPVAICWQSASGRMLEGAVHDVILDTTTPHLGCTAIERSHWCPLDTSYRTCEDLVWWLDVSSRSSVATTPCQGLFVRKHDGLRPGYGAEQRVADSLRLLDEQSDYFTAHRRATAFRWKRIGLMYKSLGDSRSARSAFGRALKTSPNPADLRQFLTVLR